ncbi:hypothetical protein ACFVYJ_01485 [Pontibacter sp. JAM-7]|uniref:Rz1-like lysis system protein LysC n=1 Tax=Pontibacter sp. JAM-7 TaxID=3366581 RepID=UPI003AF79260
MKQNGSEKQFSSQLIAAPLLLSVLTLLTGCKPTVITETIREPVPAAWLVPLPAPDLSGTYGEYIAQCEQVVKQCNADKQDIKRWSDAKTDTQGL